MKLNRAMSVYNDALWYLCKSCTTGNSFPTYCCYQDDGEVQRIAKRPRNLCIAVLKISAVSHGIQENLEIAFRYVVRGDKVSFDIVDCELRVSTFFLSSFDDHKQQSAYHHHDYESGHSQEKGPQPRRETKHFHIVRQVSKAVDRSRLPQVYETGVSHRSQNKCITRNISYS